MKIKQGFILRSVAGQHIVMPIGKKSFDFNCAITLNETGAFLWEKLSQNSHTAETLTDALLSEYDVSKEIAQSDIKKFIEVLKENDLLDE